MRRYGLYDATRGLTTILAAGVTGLLLWVATQIGTQTVARFWAAMAVVAAAGLAVALAHVVVGWTKGLRLRFSRGTFVLAFVPVLVCVGWIMLATQPGNGFAEGHVDSWSSSLGVSGAVHDLGLWHGALAFAFGIVLGHCFDSIPHAAVAEPPPADDAPQAPPAAVDEPVASGLDRERPPSE